MIRALGGETLSDGSKRSNWFYFGEEDVMVRFHRLTSANQGVIEIVPKKLHEVLQTREGKEKFHRKGKRHLVATEVTFGQEVDLRATDGYPLASLIYRVYIPENILGNENSRFHLLNGINASSGKIPVQHRHVQDYGYYLVRAYAESENLSLEPEIWYNYPIEE